MVVVIGLENILIISKAVISTDPGLDVKFRIAEGLGREGKTLTKRGLTVIGIVVLGIFTFNYAMKEFCIITLVGLLCDSFLQLFFFTTILSIDIRRMELSDLSYSAHHGSLSCSSQTGLGWRISKRERVNNFLVRGKFAQKAMIMFLIVYLFTVLLHTTTLDSFLTSVYGGGATPPTASHLPTPIHHSHVTDVPTLAVWPTLEDINRSKWYIHMLTVLLCTL